MAVDRQRLSRWLRDAGHELVEGPDDALVFTLGGESPLFVAALAADDGVMFQLRTVGLHQDKEQQHALAVQRLLLGLNRRYKLVKFAYDPTDGEVVAWVDVFVGKARLTAVQVQRCISTFRSVVLPQRERIRALARTGEDPGESLDELGATGHMLATFRGEPGEA